MSEQVAAAQAVPQRHELAAQRRRDEARRMFRESVAGELPMTAKLLGEAFGRSARWGRDRIAEVRAEDDRQAPTAAGMPQAVHSADHGTTVADPAVETGPTPWPADAGRHPPPDVGMPIVAAGMPPAGTVEMPRPVRSWPVLMLALPAFVSIWGSWVGLGDMTGFGEINLLPGIVVAGGWATINTAITLPIGVETYAAYALRAWLSGDRVPRRARRFAQWSAIGSLALGFLGQVVYHQMVAAQVSRAPWLVTTLVSGLPVVVLGMGAALAHLLHADDSQGGEHCAVKRP